MIENISQKIQPKGGSLMFLFHFLLPDKTVYLKHLRRYIHWGHGNEINQSGDKP